MAGLTLERLTARVAVEHLAVLGGFHCGEAETGVPSGTRTVLLLGPLEPGFWPHIQAQPEWGAKDAMDRWSRRVIEGVASESGATALFPFGGPPYHPFQTWALRTGRAWQSPVRMLVHADQGLLVSFRGALALRDLVDVPVAGVRPCEGCAAPCLSACPVGALSADGYDLPACHAFLEREAGADCMSGGCLVRRACPVSRSYARMQDQSAYHMRQFHK